MPSPQQQFYNFVAGNTPIVTTAETVIATTAKVNSSYPNCTFGIYFIVQLTHGTTSTAVTLTVRRSSLAGAAVATSGLLTVTAAQIGMFPFACTDAIGGEVTGQIYVLTATYTAATANSTAANAFSSVIVAE